MNYVVVLIVNEVERCPEILNAWEAAGATGITILPSTGLGHVRRAILREDLPLMPSLQDLLEDNEEEHHRTLFSVVDGQEVVDRMIAAAQEVIGDLEKPHTGFLFVMPVLQAIGLHKRQARSSKK